MNLAVICFLGNDLDLVLRKYVDLFVSGYEIGITNHHVAYMHEQTILDSSVAVDADYVHIVFAERYFSSMEMTIYKLIQLNLFPEKVKFSFTCINLGRKSIQLTSGGLSNALSMQLGVQFNGCSNWSMCKDWINGSRGLIKWIQNRKLCHLIENEGLNFGKKYSMSNELMPEINQERSRNRSVYEMQADT